MAVRPPPAQARKSVPALLLAPAGVLACTAGILAFLVRAEVVGAHGVRRES